MWKLQATATLNLKIPLLNTDGTQAIGETTGLFTKIIAPDGTAVTGYTEATFSEPNGDGIYNVSFPLTAPIKAFLLENQANPYSVTLDSTTADVDPMTIDVWVADRYIWELSSAVDLAAIDAELARILGLVMENLVEDDIVRDSNGNKTSSVVYIYDSAANATTHDKATGLVASYGIAAGYTNNLMNLFKSIKAS